MRIAIFYGLLAATALAPTAHADFVVTGSPPAATTAPPSAAADGPSGASSADEAPARETSRFRVASGFGDQVPLRFAVRQIVPRTIKVSYGPNVNPDALVDWKGGQPWNRALATAVKPLGLRLVVTTMAAEIRK